MDAYSTLSHAGFRVKRAGGNKLSLSPANLVTDEWRGFVRDHRQELLDAIPIHETRKSPSAARPASSKPRPKRQAVTGGVGTELTKIIKKWEWAFRKEGCGCKDYAAMMDRKGISWCDDHRDEIVERLVDQATGTFLGRVSVSLDRAIAATWVDTAIHCARTSEAAIFASMLAARPLTELPDNAAVITAADDRFIAGVTLLAWTTLIQHRCRFAIYDLGLSKGPMRSQLESWGVEFVKLDPMSFVIPNGVAAWQIWNKPIYIQDALLRYDNVIWLDGDTCVSGDISPMVSEKMFVPNHGGFNAKGNATRQPVTDLLGPDAQKWEGTHFPCAGVISLTKDHLHIVNEWIHRTRKLYEADLHQHCQYYDQTVLQTFYTGPLQDGSKYSNFSCPRQGDQRHILRHLVDYSDSRTVHHFGGAKKPFIEWPEFAWPKPRGAT